MSLIAVSVWCHSYLIPKILISIQDIVEQLTYLVIQHFGGNILIRISQLFDNYVDALIKALAGSSEEESLIELKDMVPFRAETDSQQLALLGTAFTIAEELLPMVVSRVWNVLNESKEAGTAPGPNIVPSANNTLEFKDWRRHLQHSLDKLRDYFCRHYVLSFIYSRDGKTRLDAQIYLQAKEEDMFWGSDPLPSLPFQVIMPYLTFLGKLIKHIAHYLPMFFLCGFYFHFSCKIFRHFLASYSNWQL